VYQSAGAQFQLSIIRCRSTKTINIEQMYDPPDMCSTHHEIALGHQTSLLINANNHGVLAEASVTHPTQSPSSNIKTSSIQDRSKNVMELTSKTIFDELYA
jgi:hypothetical protein